MRFGTLTQIVGLICGLVFLQQGFPEPHTVGTYVGGTHAGAAMNDKISEENIVPQEVIDYVKGADSDVFNQFDFLIGDWVVKGVRYLPGNGEQTYDGRWSAKYLNEGRMIMDEFRALGPGGQEVSSYVTLRTYSPRSNRWEMTGLGALMPMASIDEWHGSLKDDEMHMFVRGRSPEWDVALNTIRFFDIGKDSFNWESKMSFDGGASWINIGGLTAQRIAGDLSEQGL